MYIMLYMQNENKTSSFSKLTSFLGKARAFFASEKFQMIFYPTLYFAMAVAMVFTGCFIFQRNYYINVYVSGSSMSPTLIGGGEWGRNHYGISDNHRRTLSNLKRFDVVVTYYPSSWGSSDESYKIKRVWGFPNETITMSFEDETYNFKVTKDEKVTYTVDAKVSDKTYSFNNVSNTYRVATFNTEYRTFDTRVLRTAYMDNPSSINYERKSFSVTLKENEYFLMGDNWTGSSDSYSNMGSSQRITFDLLQGKVIAIQGTAKVVNNELTDKQKTKDRYYF